jgi:hypothetical protein
MRLHGVPPAPARPDRHRTAVAADSTVIRYLDRDDRTRMRRAAGRPKDLRRADELQRLARAIE